MAAAYDSAGNVNPAFASDINNFVMAMCQAQVVPSAAATQLAAMATQITSDGITGIASAAFTP